MREWLRGFFIDPELERKAHEFMGKANRMADQAQQTTHRAERLVKDAERKLQRMNAAEVALTTAGVLVTAGMLIGSLMTRIKQSQEQSETK